MRALLQDCSGRFREAFVELSDSTGVKFVGDTIDAPREWNNDLTKYAVNSSLFLE